MGCWSPSSWPGELFEASIPPAGESQWSGQCRFHRFLVSSIVYADADNYGLGVTITTNQSTQSGFEFDFFSAGCCSPFDIGEVINELVREFDQASCR
jgi:uncharacterized protein YfiM (DUF2279 family)